MRHKSPVSANISLLALVLGGALASAQVPSTPASKMPDSATAEMENRDPRIHGGSDISLRVKLDRPLPVGARFDVRLSPVGVVQEITVSSGEPVDRERREFLLKTKLPNEALPGDWHVSTVYLFMPGSSWTNSTINLGDVRFRVEGAPIELPKTGTATIEADIRH